MINIQDVPLDCINEAAIYYHVPAPVILSILTVEGGTKGTVRKNRNGTYDLGPMQINTLWLDELKPYGITQEMLVSNPCVNVHVGAWILAQKIASANDIGSGLANYHSMTPSKNRDYRVKVAKTFRLIMSYINPKTSPPTS